MAPVDRRGEQEANEASDAALVEAARLGDRGAQGELFARHRPLVLALCRRTLGNHGLAEEVAQEACLQALLSLGRLRRLDRFDSWLAGIGLYLSRRRLRERAREPWSWEGLAGGRLAPELPSPDPSPEEYIEVLEATGLVRRAVAGLPPGQRMAVLLFYVEGFDQREVAALLGIRVGAVKARLHKARATLRERLWSAWKEDEMEDVTTRPPDGAVAMRIEDVRRSPAREDHPERFVVLLREEDGDGRLPIWVGSFEGTAIAMLLSGTELPRPATFQFAAAILSAAGGRLTGVRISRLAGETFYAEASVEGSNGSVVVDARPSDAIALALLAGAPVTVATEVLRALEERPETERRPMREPEYDEGAGEIASSALSRWEAALEQHRSAR